MLGESATLKVQLNLPSDLELEWQGYDLWYDNNRCDI